MLKKFRLSFLIALVFSLTIICGCSGSVSTHQIPESGYLFTSFNGEFFLACGTDGRLDKIYEDGRLENLTVPTAEDLTCVWSDNDTTLVCGTGGVMLYSNDGQNFQQVKTGTKQPIYGVTNFNGKFYASSRKGIVLVSEDGINWKSEKTGVKSDLIQIDVIKDRLMTISADTNILQSQDGVKWVNENFNDTYEGYYPKYTFTNLRGMGFSFFIVGYITDEPDSPLIMSSDTGEVWLMKSLSEINDEVMDGSYSVRINAVGYDNSEIVIACDDGKVISVTECSTCNFMSEIGDKDLYALAFGKKKLLVAGQDFVYALKESSEIRQYEITPEKALEKQGAGGFIVDIRSPEDYAAGHINGAVNITADKIGDQLYSVIQNYGADVIFYSDDLIKNQTAIDVALYEGFSNVYNLGSISDWPYEIVK